MIWRSPSLETTAEKIGTSGKKANSYQVDIWLIKMTYDLDAEKCQLHAHKPSKSKAILMRPLHPALTWYVGGSFKLRKDNDF